MTSRASRLSVCWLVAVGMLACGDDNSFPSPTESSPQSDSAMAELCGNLDITGGSEPSGGFQKSCATGPTTGSGVEPVPWGTLDGTLCNISGIPAAGLGGSTCSDPGAMEIDVTESGLQTFSPSFVVGDLSDPHTSNPFAPCTPSAVGTITVSPSGAVGSDSGGAAFTITQTTAEFVVGSGAQFPPLCAVAITDSHGQQILVNVGTQISVACTNADCSGGSGAIVSTRRRRPSLALTRRWSSP